MGVDRSAVIIQFPERVNRFTVADRITLLSWESQRQGIRLAIHARQDGDPPEVGEFASIYPAGTPFAAWGAARQGRKIRLWRGRDGRDIGAFATMGEALAAISPPTRA